MSTVTQQRKRQAILISETPIDPGLYPEKLELFDVDGNPIVVGGFQSRSELVHTTGSLAFGATENSTLTAFPGWRIFKVVTNRPAWIRMYATDAHRTQDVGRSRDLDPSTMKDHGLLMEMSTDISLSYDLTPEVDLASNDVDSSDFYLAVTNLDSSTGSVITTYSYIRTE